MNADPKDVFRFDRERAVADLRGAENDLWPINDYSDADELNQLLEAAQSGNMITAPRSAHLFVYPLSICEPDPLLAACPGSGPTLLGHELKLREEEGEDPIAFTLRLLEEIAVEANALVGEFLADSESLDRIAAYMNRPGPWNGGDVCEMVAQELEAGGRVVLDNAED
jgi:hypothetical protein